MICPIFQTGFPMENPWGKTPSCDPAAVGRAEIHILWMKIKSILGSGIGTNHVATSEFQSSCLDFAHRSFPRKGTGAPCRNFQWPIPQPNFGDEVDTIIQHTDKQTCWKIPRLIRRSVCRKYM